MPTSDLDRKAMRAAALKILADRVNAAFKEAKEALAEALGPEGRKNATFDGMKLASISVSKIGRISIDERLLTAYVEENYPTEVYSAPKIRPAFLDAIKKATEAAGEPSMPDGTLDVPGVSLGDSWPVVRKTPGADELVEQLWRTGRLTIDGHLKELE